MLNNGTRTLVVIVMVLTGCHGAAQRQAPEPTMPTARLESLADRVDRLEHTLQVPSPVSDHVFGGIPINVDSERPLRVIDHVYFLVGYSEDRGQPAWVAYRIGPAVDLSAYPSRSRFSTYRNGSYRITHDDYTHSGYSRGHMAPRMAISSRYGKEGNDATYVMDNVVPQSQRFNDVQWGQLEEWIAGRKMSRNTFIPGWADEHQEIWVIVGPVFDNQPQFIADGLVEVPFSATRYSTRIQQFLCAQGIATFDQLGKAVPPGFQNWFLDVGRLIRVGNDGLRGKKQLRTRQNRW